MPRPQSRSRRRRGFEPRDPDLPCRRRIWRALVVVALLGVMLATIAPSGAAVRAADGPHPPATEPARAAAFQVGQPAPDFTVTTLDGQPLTSADLLAQEKPFILYFFATW